MAGTAAASVAGASPVQRNPARQPLALVLMLGSGFAGLGYQIVWTQQNALWLGHETAAVLAVLASLFGGLALGALALGSRIDRSSNPAQWYAACEAVIGLWSLALVFVMPEASAWLLQLIGAQPSPGRHWAVAFFGTFALLLPATASMGATLPAMERALSRCGERHEHIAPLYAANTFGAVLGVLGAAFWLVPSYGLRSTALVCVALNFLCAVVAQSAFAQRGSHAPTHTIVAGVSGRGGLMTLVVTGLLGIAYEVLVVRVLSQVAENTVYTFALLLAVYLIGTALGAALYARWLRGAGGADRLRDTLLRLLAATCLLSVLCLAGAEVFKHWVLARVASGFVAALFAEALLAIMAFLLPTLLMGALFSHLCTQSRAAGSTFGLALGVNTLGAAIAPLLFGVVLLPRVGTTYALLLVAAGYLALSTRRAWRTPTQWAAAVAIGALAGLGPSLAIVDIPEGGRLVSHAEGSLATVSVVQDASGVASLHINNRQQEGSSATVFADARQALLPMLLHPAPRRALFLGLGTGVTARSATSDPELMVDAVELLPEVVQASTLFARMLNVDERNSRLRIMTADARRFVRAAPDRYDVIVSDNFHPARSGSGSLYTVEHFEAIRDRLTQHGVFCQWLPLHQIDLDTLRIIVRAFRSAFPGGLALLATNSLDTPVLGLVGRRENESFDLDAARTRLAQPGIGQRAAELDVPDDLALLGAFVAGPEALARFAGGAPVNTDDHPVVAYRAPRITYAPDSRPRDRLIALLHQLEIRPNELVPAHADDGWDARLAAYWAARNRFIEAGRDVEPTGNVREMLAQVREPLLAVLHVSPDFRPAYDPLLRMAMALAATDVTGARELLQELQRAQPARPEAAQALLDLRDRG